MTTARILALASLLSPLLAVADVPCKGGKGDFTVDSTLEWCARDHGYNEGAACGLHALTGTDRRGSEKLPQMTPFLANSWDRSKMIAAARKAVSDGRKDEGVRAAICCQIHNQVSHACLEGNVPEVARWLQQPPAAK